MRKGNTRLYIHYRVVEGRKLMTFEAAAMQDVEVREHGSRNPREESWHCGKDLAGLILLYLLLLLGG